MRLPALLILMLSASALAAPAPRPNILVILADDLGFSDLGCYGGEIRTPNLDRLAADGVRFTQLYNSARCSPSRASLLTGVHPHQAGFPNLSGVLATDCVTIPEALAPAGYRSYMVGKWHLSAQSSPTVRGFDEFYGMIGGFNTCWKEDPFYTRLPAGRPRRPYAAGAFYSTDVFGDYALDFLDEAARSGKPWFMYLAFNAPHFPLHAKEEDIARYEAVYARGWDVIRQERFERQKKLGIIPASATLTPRSVIPANRFNTRTGWADRDNPAWDTLPADRRADLARRMAVYAAMVDRLDQNVGRVVERLRKAGQFDNTLILFLSDNGACAEWDPFGFDGSSGPDNILHRGEDLKRIGAPDSYVSYGSGWANACNTPWRLYKHYGHEGGISTPFIAHWPAGLKRAGQIDPRPLFIADLMPTCLELAGADYPRERDGKPTLDLAGVSLVPAFRGEALRPRQIIMEHEGNRAVREGRWKLVALDGHPWELYDIEADRSELHDLAADQPEVVQRLSKAWDDWAARCMKRPAQADASSPAIANKALAIECEVEPRSKDGVILAQGGNQHGYALHLRDGRVVFSVRVSGKVTEIVSDPAPAGRLTLSARLAKDGAMTLAINGKPVAQGRAPGLIPVQPIDELSIGQDSRSAVGNYESPHPLQGTVQKVRIKAE